MHLFMKVVVLCIVSIQAVIFAEKLDCISITPCKQGYRIDFSLPDFTIEQKDSKNSSFHIISASQCSYSGKVGFPKLPVFLCNLVVGGDEHKAAVSAISIKGTMEKTLKQKLYPVQESWSKTRPLSERPFSMDHAFYKSDKTYSEPFARISNAFTMRGIHAITVVISPFSYNPGTNTLTAATTGTFVVSCNTKIPRMEIPQPFMALAQKVFQNYSDVQLKTAMEIPMNGGSEASLMSLPTAGYNTRYLIITDPALESALSSFISHKEELGYKVDVFNTNETGTNEPTAIKKFLVTRYNNWRTRPVFILLVGDNEQIPAWTGEGDENPLTDLIYSTFDGDDVIPDVFIGRFPAADANDVYIMTEKTIFFESILYKFLSGGQEGTFIASDDNAVIGEGTQNYAIANCFEPNGFTCHKRYIRLGATKDDVVGDINNGLLYTIYTGHGHEQGWGCIGIDNSDVYSFTNYPTPFVLSFSCHTGNFGRTDCFMEAWLRAYDAGGVFSFGSSVCSQWDEDDCLEKVMCDNMYSEDGIFQMGIITLLGKIAVYNDPKFLIEIRRSYMEKYNVLGDPSLMYCYPEWKRMRYMRGNRVMYDHIAYRSKVNSNYWSPDEYPSGWEVLP